MLKKQSPEPTDLMIRQQASENSSPIRSLAILVWGGGLACEMGCSCVYVVLWISFVCILPQRLREPPQVLFVSILLAGIVLSLGLAPHAGR